MTMTEGKFLAAARIIVETTLQDFVVDPSQGSHFFQNLVSFGIAYLTIDPPGGSGCLDWQWLADQRAEWEGALVRHIHLEHPLDARVDGRNSQAVVLKRARRVLLD